MPTGLKSNTSSPGRTLRARLPYLVAVGAILMVDRLSKGIVERAFDPGGGRTIIEGFFDLVYVQNPGVAFGVLADGASTTKVVLLSAVAVFASVSVVVYSVRNPVTERMLQAGLAMILGGALGNLYDRVSYAYVIDFLYFHIGDYYWPAFNVADTCISVGVALLLTVVVRDEIRARS